MEYVSQHSSNEILFDHLCRVCAANTKGKYTTLPECVDILKTPQLKEKLEKHLYLTINEQDEFPKVLCMKCFRQVEATASLTKIAKHTQKKFRDFMSSMKGGSLPSLSSDCNQDANTSEYIPLMAKNCDLDKNINLRQTSPPPLARTTHNACHKDEVVVNVSINEPLTRETQHRIISASQKNKKLMDTRFTPKSIAQRSFSNPPAKANSSTMLNSNAGIGGTSKEKTYNIGVIKNLQAPLVTSYSSGGYVIQSGGGNASATGVTSNGLNNTNSNNNHNVMPMKKKNDITQCSVIKAVTQSGQISLLKRSNRTQPTKTTTPAQTLKTATNVSSNVVTLPENEAVEELPEKMIIATAKRKQDKETAERENRQRQEAEHLRVTKEAFSDDIYLGKVIKDYDLLKLILKALKWPYNRNNMEFQINRLKASKFTDIISDPNLLQDTDLTQILGPYLTPFIQNHTQQQLIQQQQQQKQQQEQTQQQKEREREQKEQEQLVAAVAAATAATNKLNQSNGLTSINLANAIPYKLPAETSVQLVPASPEPADTLDVDETLIPLPLSITMTPQIEPLKRENTLAENIQLAAKKLKLNHYNYHHNSSIIISDDEDNNAVPANQPLKSNIDKSLQSQFTMLKGMQQMVKTSRESLLKHKRLDPTRRQSNSNIITVSAHDDQLDIDMNEDDMAGAFENRPSVSTIQAAVIAATKSHSTSAITNSTDNPILKLLPNSFLLNQENNKPKITRPIIKRRKVQNLQSNGTATNASTSPSTNTPVIKTIESDTVIPQLIMKELTSNWKSEMSLLKEKSISPPATVVNSTAAGRASAVTTPTSTPPKSRRKSIATPRSQRKQSMAAIVDNLKNIATEKSTITASPSSSTSPSTSAIKTKTSAQKSAEVSIASTNNTTSTTIEDSHSIENSVITVSAVTANPSRMTKSTDISSSIAAAATAAATTLNSSTTSSKIAPATPTTTSTSKSTPTTTITQQQKTSTKKLSNSKSALGKQLLEAIGLQKIGQSTQNSLNDNHNNSVQKIRSALKKSLKQAQDQQQQLKLRKHEGTINNSVANAATTKDISNETRSNKNVINKTNKNHNNNNNVEDVEAIKIIKKSSVIVMAKTKDNNSNIDEDDEDNSMALKDEENMQKDEQSTRTRSRKRKEREEHERPRSSASKDGTTSSPRPARVSKTMSKYYKGPGTISPRSTRSRH